LLFGEHTWGSSASVSDPDGAQTLAQWEEKKRFLERAGATADGQVAGGGARGPPAKSRRACSVSASARVRARVAWCSTPRAGRAATSCGSRAAPAGASPSPVTPGPPPPAPPPAP